MAYRHVADVYDPKFAGNKRRRDLEDMLGEWYGKEFAETESTAWTEQTCKLADCLDDVVKKHFDQTAALLVALKENWAKIIAPPMNKFVQLYTVRDHKAIIEVMHPAFLMELRKKNTVEEWCKKLNAACPELEINAVEFIPSGQQHNFNQ